MKAFSSIDIYYWLKENKEKLLDAFIEKIKQKEQKFCFVLRKNKKKNYFEIFLPYSFYFSKRCFKTKEFPPSFCMLLRKYLINQKIKNIIHQLFERVVEIETEKYKIIIELIQPSNLILCDKNYKIIAALNEKEWKDRKIRAGEIFKYPPKPKNILSRSFFELTKIFSECEKEVVKFLAVDCGLGGKYAEELCALANVEKTKKCSELLQNEIDNLQNDLDKMLNMKVSPAIYIKENSFIDFSPFKLSNLQTNFLSFDSFNDAVRTFYKNFEKKLNEKKIEEIRQKIEKIRKKQKEKLRELIERETYFRKIGNLLYQNYLQFKSIFSLITELRDKKLKWKEIENRIKKEYPILEKIHYRKGLVEIKVNSLKFFLNFTKSLEENANEFFENAKKLSKKIERLKKMLKEEIVIQKEIKEEKIEKKERKKWYEKFRWFISSNGFLVVSGKDVKTNEELIRKYVGKYDLILHADIHGSPFTVIKNEKKVIPLPPETIYEAAQFTASYSRAWALKLGSIHVYYFTPDQIVKTGGLPKGSFLIKGKRGWLEKIKLRISIGIIVNKDFSVSLTYGPPSVVRKRTPYLITLMPGEKTGEELANEIKRELLSKLPFEARSEFEKIPLTKFLEIIPYGKGEIVIT